MNEETVPYHVFNYLSSNQQQMTKQILVRVVGLFQRCYKFSWDNQKMDVRLRVDIVKRDALTKKHKHVCHYSL